MSEAIFKALGVTNETDALLAIAEGNKFIGEVKSATGATSFSAALGSVVALATSGIVLSRVESATGKKGEEAHGVVLAWKNSAEQLPAVTAERDTYKTKSDGYEATEAARTQAHALDDLIAKGEKEFKLTPATITSIRAQVESKDLTIKGATAMVDALPVIEALKTKHAPHTKTEKTAVSNKELAKNDAPKFEGKAYEDLSGTARAHLSADEPELFNEMRRDWENRGEPGPSEA